MHHDLMNMVEPKILEKENYLPQNKYKIYKCKDRDKYSLKARCRSITKLVFVIGTYIGTISHSQKLLRNQI